MKKISIALLTLLSLSTAFADEDIVVSANRISIKYNDSFSYYGGNFSGYDSSFYGSSFSTFGYSDSVANVSEVDASVEEIVVTGHTKDMSAPVQTFLNTTYNNLGSYYLALFDLEESLRESNRNCGCHITIDANLENDVNSRNQKMGVYVFGQTNEDLSDIANGYASYTDIPVRTNEPGF